MIGSGVVVWHAKSKHDALRSIVFFICDPRVLCKYWLGKLLVEPAYYVPDGMGLASIEE
ncbi:hypothetical protein PULV_a2625 [Pseudoalteromonas ulvae UL12]|nr:hypothetical protein [Pseudoalteromonas ulvae UL12]